LRIITHLVITAAIEGDADRVVPHLSFEDITPVVSKESLKPGRAEVRAFKSKVFSC